MQKNEIKRALEQHRYLLAAHKELRDAKQRYVNVIAEKIVELHAKVTQPEKFGLQWYDAESLQENWKWVKDEAPEAPAKLSFEQAQMFENGIFELDHDISVALGATEDAKYHIKRRKALIDPIYDFLADMADSVVSIKTFEQAASINVTLEAKMYTPMIKFEADPGHEAFDPKAKAFVLHICQTGSVIDHFRCLDGTTEDNLVIDIESV